VCGGSVAGSVGVSIIRQSRTFVRNYLIPRNLRTRRSLEIPATLRKCRPPPRWRLRERILKAFALSPRSKKRRASRRAIGPSCPSPACAPSRDIIMEADLPQRNARECRAEGARRRRVGGTSPIHPNAGLEGRKTPYAQTRPTVLREDPNLPHVWLTLGGPKEASERLPSCHRDTLFPRAPRALARLLGPLRVPNRVTARYSGSIWALRRSHALLIRDDHFRPRD